MFKGKIAGTAIAVAISAGMFVAGAMPMEKDSTAKKSDQTTMSVPSEGKTAKRLKPQATCPVMGGKIDKKVFVDHKGNRVYFCCPGCIETFKKDPAKYLKVIADRGESVEVIKALKPQSTCPVMGGKIDKTSYLDYEGKRVYFCCDGCKEPFMKDPAKYLKKMKDAGEEPETIK